MKPVFKNAMLVSLCVGMMAPVLAACNQQTGSNNNTERTLRIATMNYSANDPWFRQRYTELFEFANPNIKIELVSPNEDMFYGTRNSEEERKDPLESLKEMMQGDNPPDVVMVGYEQIGSLIADNLLTQLDPMIQKDKFDVTDIVPAVMNGLKQKGNGNLYALANTFSSSALIYNKQIFTERGVEFPKDKMTWNETFDLARRVAHGEGEDRKYGFTFSTYSGGDNLFYASQIYSAPLELSVFDAEGTKMTVDSDQWENVWKTIVQLKTDKILPEPMDMEKMRMDRQSGGVYNPYMYDDFLSGRVAMAVIQYGQLDQIINANKYADGTQGFTPIDWDVVTLPIHQENPEVGGNMYMDGIMGINAKAQNVEDAWEFIKFVNGEDWARLKANSDHNIVARKKYINTMKDGVEFNIDAFTTLMPATNFYESNMELFRKIPYLHYVNDIAYKKFDEVAKGNLGVREALKQWQTEGDAALKQMKENPDYNPYENMMPMPMESIAVPAG